MAVNNLPLESQEITEKIRKISEEELNETDQTRYKCLEELKLKIKNEQNLVCNTSDDHLLQFLRVKKFNTDKAFALLKRFYLHKKHYKFLYKSYTPKQKEHVMKANLMSFLPRRTAKGCAIWTARIGMWDPDIVNFEDLVSFGLLCHEKVLRNPVTQISGIVSVVDFKNFSWSHLFHLPASSLTCFVSAAQDCFPIRHREIHIINSPRVFQLLFAMIKPLISHKMRNRIHFHGQDISSLHQFVPEDLLPEEFGGTQGKYDNTQFYDLLLRSEQEFVQSNRFGYTNEA